MPMNLAYGIALAEARSCLAALADTASDLNESIHFERLLLDLDRLHPDGPGLSMITGSKAELLDRLEYAVDGMIDDAANRHRSLSWPGPATADQPARRRKCGFGEVRRFGPILLGGRAAWRLESSRLPQARVPDQVVEPLEGPRRRLHLPRRPSR